MSVDTQSSHGTSQPPPTTSLNPVSGVLANLFGIPTSISQGGIMYGGGGANFQFAQPSFGRGSGFERVPEFLKLESPFSEFIQSPEARELIGTGMDIYGESVLPAYREMVETGSPVDVDPLVRNAIYQVAESLSPTAGLYSSDVNAEALRQAALLNVGAQEEARARQLAALGGAPTVLGGPATLANQLLTLGEEINLAGTAPGRAVAMLQLLAGLQPTGAISRGNISESSGKSTGVGLGEAAGGIGAGIGSAIAACWCSAVYYPYLSVDWFRCRKWILDGWDSPFGKVFRFFYIKNGRRLAYVLHHDLGLREKFRPLFVWIRDRGAEYERSNG